MKIVYILEQFHLHGGAEKITCIKANWFAKKGFDVTIISNNQNTKKNIYSLEKSIKFIDLGINYKTGTSYLHPKHLILVPKHIIKLHKALTKIKPDVVILLSLQFDYYFLPFITKSKIIREFHSSRYLYNTNRNKNNSFFKKFKYKLHDFIEKKYTYNVILTPEEKKHYNSQNTIIIPNGINNTAKQTAKLINKTVISAGRIAPVKGLDKLINTWYIVAKKHSDWKLEIYGGGNKKDIEKLQEQINKLNLQKQVCLCGQTDDLNSKMLEASIYVMSSKTECFPMVLLEAQSIGLPIVSFDCPYGPRNIITNNQDGILVEDQNNDKLANAIMQLIENKNTRIEMGKTAKKNILKLQEQEVMNMWFKLFKA